MQQVLDKLEAIEDKIDNLLQWKATIEERCQGHREKTDELRSEIYSIDGLKVKVQKLWNCKGAFRDKVAMWQDLGMYVLKAVVVFCLLAVIMFALKLYKSS